MSKQDAEVSKFLSYVLRHEPQAMGLTLIGESQRWGNGSGSVEKD